jgi:NACalpha-BTF3-like transcription factor
MPRKSDTRDKVFEAADLILLEGGKPTQQNVREKIGVGSISTINSALNEWWSSLSQRMNAAQQESDLPEPVLRVAEQLWGQALGYSERRFQEQARRFASEMEVKLSEVESQCQDLRLRNDYLLDENRALSEKVLKRPEVEASALTEMKSLKDELFNEVKAKEALALEVRQLQRELEYQIRAGSQSLSDDLISKLNEKELENNDLSSENKRLYQEVRVLTEKNQSLREAMYNQEKEATKQQHRLELVIAQQDARYQDALKALEDCKNQLAKDRR